MERAAIAIAVGVNIIADPVFVRIGGTGGAAAHWLADTKAAKGPGTVFIRGRRNAA